MKNQMITEVSHVISISGVARIRTPDGVLHELKVGDVLQPGTEVLLADATSFAFELGVPELAQPIDIPADQQPAMPAMGAAAGDQQATAQINALQQAILAGQDPTQAFEAAAAGVPADAGGTGAGSGNSGFVSIVRTGGSTIAEAGYDTTALASDPLLQVDDPVAPIIAVADTTAPSAPIVTILDDLNNDGVLAIAELGDATAINVRIDLPADALVGDILAINNGNTNQSIVLTIDQINAGFVDTTVDRPADGASVNVVATVTDTAGNVSPEGSDNAVIELPLTVVQITVPNTVVEGDALIYNVSLSGSSAGQTSFSFNFGSGTATAGADYNSTPVFSNGVVLNDDGTITVPAGVSSFSVTVPTIDDTVVDAASPETLPLTIGGVSATGNILDNDQPDITQVSLGDEGDTVVEGTALVYGVTLSATTSIASTYSFVLGGGSAQEADFNRAGVSFSNGVILNGDGTITVPAGVSSFSVTVPTIDDTVVDAASPETLPLTIGGVSATGNILDNDEAPEIPVGQIFSYNENQLAGATIGTVTATDDIAVTSFRFAATGTNTSGDGYFTIGSDGVIHISTAGAAAGVNDFEQIPNSHIYAIEALDAGGNVSTAVNVTLNELDLDEIPPTVIVDITDPQLTYGETSPVTFTFSEAVYGFVLTDLSVVGGTVTGLVDSGDHIHWSATFTPDSGYAGTASVTVQNASYTDLAGNLGSAGSDVTLITPITYSSTDTGWLMNYNDNSNSFDMKVKGGSATISAGGSIYWDIIVHDNDGNAALTLNYGSLPKDQNNIPLAALSYEQLYSEGGEMIFRVYLTAISTITLSQPNQFDINVINASGASQIINTDEFVAPHSNYNDNYSLSFDSHAITEGHDQDWLSNDNNGGEFIGSITYQTGQTVSYLGGADVVYGTTGHDTLSGDAGNDYLDGRAGNDTLHGGADNDVLMGGYGNDVLYGDAGADTLYGNENNDTLIGGLGNDILTGGDGADIFKWTADDINIASGAPFSDTITDFSITEGDKLDLSDVLTGDTTTLSNYLDVQASGSDVEISVYANGINDGTPDMTILLQNPTDSLADLQVYLQSIGVIHNP